MNQRCRRTRCGTDSGGAPGIGSTALFHSPGVKKAIDEFITLNTDEEVEVDMSDPENINAPAENTVDTMAKRAMKKRI